MNIGNKQTNILKKSKNHNPNYLATVCKIENIQPIPDSTQLAKTIVNGYDIIVPRNITIGTIVIYFPMESSLSQKYLSANNLYNLSEYERNANKDIVKDFLIKAQNATDELEKKQALQLANSNVGFFNKYGRVRMIKLRGQYSQGFIAHTESLENAYKELKGINWEELVGVQFDQIGDDIICKKYVPTKPTNINNNNQSQFHRAMRKLSRFNKLIPGEFMFHYDTVHLREHLTDLNPDDVVEISVKMHGTSVVISNILCNKKLSLINKIKKFFKIPIISKEYSNIYSSRRMIKNLYIDNPKGFYDIDIYGCVNRDFSKFLLEGMTVYGEIVGYLENSQQMIQKNYDYGCAPGNWKFIPYRITTTNEDGTKKEWSVGDVWRWTNMIMNENPDLKDKLLPIKILYRGKLSELYKDIPIDQNWHNNLLERMKHDSDNFGMELNEPLCIHKVPREGIVIRIKNDKIPRAWKLKTEKFYIKEAKSHDNGEIDMEENS